MKTMTSTSWAGLDDATAAWLRNTVDGTVTDVRGIAGEGQRKTFFVSVDGKETRHEYVLQATSSDGPYDGKGITSLAREAALFRMLHTTDAAAITPRLIASNYRVGIRDVDGIICKGGGYNQGWNDGKGLGIFRGLEYTEYDVYEDTDDPMEVRIVGGGKLRHNQREQLVLLTINGQPGFGDCTMIAFGDLKHLDFPRSELPENRTRNQAIQTSREVGRGS